MKGGNRIRMRCFYFYVMLLISQASSRLIFKENAVDFVEAGFKKIMRMGVAKLDFIKLEISAKPLLMVQNMKIVDKDRVTIEIKSGDGQWKAIDERPSIRGGVYTWTESDIAPCKSHLIRIWVHGKDESQSSFQFPDKIEAANADVLASSGYRPHKPRGLEIVQSGDSVVISWTPSQCAELYDITYQKVTDGETFSKQILSTETPSITLEDGIESCSEYDFKVNAVFGNEYSEDTLDNFITHPEANAAQKIDPLLIPSTQGITTKWKAFDKLPCVKDYIVTVCKEGNECPESKDVKRDDSLQFLQFSSHMPLEQCSDYSLHIKPLFPGVNLYEKVISFRTVSPPIANVTSHLTAVEAEANDEQMITVKWNTIQCANHYKVFQKVNTPDGEWERIGITSKNYFQQKGVPCTEYKYGVKVTVGDQESGIVGFRKAIMTKIDKSGPYVPPNLQIEETSDGARLSWDHGKCINSYRIRSCEYIGLDNICYEEQEVMDDSAKHKLTHSISNLKPCSNHVLEIFPSTIDGEFAAESVQFKTKSPPASPPDDINVHLNKMTNKVDLNWSKVTCATGYKIHQKLKHSDTETKWTSDDMQELSVSLESPEPCVTYSYGVSSIIGLDESEPTNWFEVPVPPRFDNSNHLVIEKKVNDSVTFSISNNDNNRRCKMEKYHVKYGGEESFIKANNIADGKITVKVKSVDAKIETRIKYEGFENWSDWLSTDRPKTEMQVGQDMAVMLPIILGSVALFLLVVTITICIVKKKKSELKSYDLEKVEGKSEECEKLKSCASETRAHIGTQ